MVSTLGYIHTDKRYAMHKSDSFEPSPNSPGDPPARGDQLARIRPRETLCMPSEAHAFFLMHF